MKINKSIFKTIRNIIRVYCVVKLSFFFRQRYIITVANKSVKSGTLWPSEVILNEFKKISKTVVENMGIRNYVCMHVCKLELQVIFFE